MKKYVSLCTIFIVSWTLYAQQPVEYPSLGLSFSIPNGWVGQEYGDGYLIAHETIPGFVIISTHEANDLATLIKEAQIGLADDNGTNLKATSSPTSFKTNGVACEYAGTMEWTPAKAYAIGLLSPNSGGIVILGASTEELFSETHISVVKEIANSVKFTKIIKPQPADQWNEMLQNVRLTYMSSYSSNTYGGGGYSQKTTIDLCGEGFFNYKDDDVNSFGQYAGAYSQQRGGGTWQLEPGRSADTPVLKLTFYNGEVYSYDLSMSEGKLLLNGYRYFRTYANDATEEFRPLCN